MLNRMGYETALISISCLMAAKYRFPRLTAITAAITFSSIWSGLRFSSFREPAGMAAFR
jgi:hypothetical protein